MGDAKEKMIKNLIKFWPFLFIFTIWFIFSSPYFLKSQAPFAVSYQMNNFAPWNAYSQFAGPVKNGAMPDVITQIYPWRHLVIQIWKSGHVPLWNPYSFTGTPLLANYQSAVLSPFNILFSVLPFVDGWSILVLLQPLLAGLFTYIFTRSLKRSKLASLTSAASFMFCGFITVWMGYATLGYAILFLPLALFSIEKYFLEKRARFLIILSLSIPLAFFSGHFQISVYFLLVVMAFILYKALATKDIASLTKVSLSIFFGLLISMPQLLPSMEFYSQSLRGDIFQKGEVIPWVYLSTLFAPDFFGNPVTRNDWFGHYAEWNGFIGVLPLIFAFYGLTFKRKSQSLFFFVLGTIALLFSLDSKLTDFLIALKIPVLSTSAASRIIVVYSFMFSVLAAFGMDQLFEDIKKRKLTKVFKFLSFCLGIVALVWILLSFKILVPLNKVSIAQNNFKLPSMIFTAGLAVIILSMINKKLIFFCGFLLFVLVSFDMLRFATKWQPFEPKSLIFAELPTTSAFSKISGKDRIISNLEAGVSDYYNLLSLEGYDALYIKRYGEFAASIADGKLKQSYRSVVVFPKYSPNTSAMMNLLGTKYVVHKNSDDGAGWTFPVWSYRGGQFAQIYGDSAYKFYENRDAFPHAFLAGSYRVIKDPQQIISTMIGKDIDLRKEIILEKNPDIAQTKDNVGSATVIKYSPNEVDVEVRASSSGLLFLSDNYYNGWTAIVDNIKTPIYRADYSFRAVPIEKGNHAVKFAYVPFSFMLGIWLAALGVLGIVIVSSYSRIGVRKSASSS